MQPAAAKDIWVLSGERKSCVSYGPDSARTLLCAQRHQSTHLRLLQLPKHVTQRTLITRSADPPFISVLSLSLSLFLSLSVLLLSAAVFGRITSRRSKAVRSLSLKFDYPRIATQRFVQRSVKLLLELQFRATTRANPFSLVSKMICYEYREGRYSTLIPHLLTHSYIQAPPHVRAFTAVAKAATNSSLFRGDDFCHKINTHLKVWQNELACGRLRPMQNWIGATLQAGAGGHPRTSIKSNQIKFISYTRSQNTNMKLENKNILLLDSPRTSASPATYGALQMCFDLIW